MTRNSFTHLFRTGLLLKRKRSSRLRASFFTRCEVEQLEPRVLLAPTWTAFGPKPQAAFFTPGPGGPGPGTAVVGGESVSGRVSALVYDPDPSQAFLLLGAASGGIWKTTDVNSNTPSWTQVSDVVNVNAGGLVVPVPAQSVAATGINNIGAITVDPRPGQTQVIWAGTGEANYGGDMHPGAGILRSTDGGTTWELLPTQQFSGHSIAKIIVNRRVNAEHPTVDNATIYAAVVPSGVADPDATDGIWRSTNGGVTWEGPLKGGFANPNVPMVVTDLEYTIVNNEFNLWAAVGNVRSYQVGDNANNGIWKSRDGGQNWIHQGVANDPLHGLGVGRISLAADHRPRRDPIVYALEALPVGLGVTPPGAPGGPLPNPIPNVRLLRTMDNGRTWGVLSRLTGFLGGKQGFFNLAIGLVPGRPNVVYVGGLDVYQTTNGTAPLPGDVTFAKIDVPGGDKAVPHVDHHAFAFNLADPPSGNPAYVVFDGDDGGIWKFTPKGANAPGWKNLNASASGPGDYSHSLQTTQVNAVTSNNVHNALFLEGSQDNDRATRRLTQNNDVWNTPPVPNLTIDGINFSPGYGDVSKVRFDRSGAQAYLVMHTAARGSGFEISLQEATQPDVSWTEIKQDPMAATESFPFSPALAVSPQTATKVVTGSSRVWERRRANDNLVPISPDLASAVISALAYANDNTIWVGYDKGQIFRTTNDGVNGTLADWPAAGGPNPPWGVRKISSIFVDPNNANNVYVTLEDKRQQVYLTTNGTAANANTITWTNISGDLPSLPAYTLTLDPSSHIVYVGNEVGVYASKNGGTNWDVEGSGMPTVQVGDLQIDGPDGLLVAGTYGRGVYTEGLPIELDPPGTEGFGWNGNLGNFADACFCVNYTVVIDWGDGSPLDTTTGAVTLVGTTYQVTGSHTYIKAGFMPVKATVTDCSGLHLILTGGMQIRDASLTPTVATVNGSVGSALSNVSVGTFTDGDTNATASNYAASISWGDGTFSWGSVSGSAGSFGVTGSHTYVNAGSFPVTVSIQDKGGGSIAVANSTATISGALSMSATTATASEGLGNGSMIVASFTDTYPTPQVSDYTGTINWGDGHSSAASFAANGSGGFSVSGANVYGAAGTYPISISIQNIRGATATLLSSIAAQDAPLSATGTSFTVAQGSGFANAVAHFVHADPNASVGRYSASIDWGDGSSSEESLDSIGSVSAESRNSFVVTGFHTYVTPGTYPVQVTISDVGGSTASTSSTVTVTAVAPSVTSLGTLWGPPGGGTVVNISGNNFNGATAVKFGATAATGFMVNDNGSITAVAPAGSVGTVDVTVTTSAGTSATSTADKFTYLNAAPTVTSRSPTSGPTGGGTSVTITGTNLAAATQVNFGTVAATSFTITSPTTISAVAPAQLAGTVHITVVSPYGTSATSVSDQYTYTGTAPTVTTIDPTSGPAAGGAGVTIIGMNLNGATAVKFGTTAATAFTIVSSTQIIATSPALTAGTYHTTVTTPYGTSSTSSADQFTAVAAPTVTSLSPTSGPTGGGTSVTVTGTNFTGAYQVYFGSAPATTFTVNSATSITATAPAQTSGIVDVTVVTVGGTSALSGSDRYTYNATAPTVTAVAPNRGPTAGGTSVTIAGTNFNGATQVQFGSTAATSFTVVSATQITVTAPALAASTVDIKVTTPYGTSSTGAADQFTYVDSPAPAVTSISPSSGAMAGGTSVTITGTNFTAATAVYFGSVKATSFTVNSDTQITATTPNRFAGLVDVSVTTPYGSSPASLGDQYTYTAALPSVTALGTSTGTTAGGTSVTISGSNLTGATRVYFGNILATSFTVNSDSSVTATSPIQATGVVDITVVTPLGTSATSSADRFTYTAATGIPSVTSLSPTSGPTGGGTSITITGTGFTGATQLAFGNLQATSFTVNSDTSVTAIAPYQPTGGVDVTVTTANGTSAIAAADIYTYNATAPTVTAIAPTSGPTIGGTAVAITGTNFNGATQVTFGTTVATSFVANSSTCITAIAPALSAATYHITVTTPAGTSPTSSADQFTAVTAPAPTVTSISPTSGPMAGGTSVVITGTYFTGATKVVFGPIASSYTVNSATQITATAPAQASGIVDIAVTTPSGTSATSTSDQYTYNAIAPSVTAVSPTTGPTAGGTSVTITGSNLTGAVAVYFGSSAAPVFKVNSDSSITADSPLAVAGTVDITVTTANGTSTTGVADQFTYQTNSSTPTVTGLSPTSGPANGGTSVTITGTNLTGATAVFFGSVPATSFTVNSATQISAVSPFEAAGTVDVTVTTVGGTSSTSSADHYTYNNVAPTVTSVSPNSGTTAGGIAVTISGTGFTGATAVNFGSTTASIFTVNSDTSLTAIAPIAQAGTVDITVTTPSGTSATGVADHFTFNSTSSTPTVSLLNPTSGPTGGGTSVGITGTNFLGATDVFFGSVRTGVMTVNSSSSITATAPALAAGNVYVTVATPNGISANSGQGLYNSVGLRPTVAAISPVIGPTTGGTVVTIYGTNFNGVTAVSFGGTAATSFTVVSPTQIIATSPPHAPGVVNVTVTSPYGTSTEAALFTYGNWPTVGGIGPGSGWGGTIVIINGTNYSCMTIVYFGVRAATSITINSSTQLTAVAPNQGPGVRDITVATETGTSAISTADQFTYVAPVPSITGVSPNTGSTNGGTGVTISGSGFTGATGVFFGGIAASAFTVGSDTSITTTSPAQGAGTVDVVVITPDGGASAIVTADHFTYTASAPTVTAVSPTSGSTVGGTSVTITGTNLIGATQVLFGTTPATSFTVNSATQITVTAPPHVTGTVDITVTTAGGTSSTSSSDQFTYSVQAPTVTAVGPVSGPTTGVLSVVITGTNFSSVTAVKFGTTAAVTFAVNSPTQIMATAPAHATGVVDITVTAGGGTSATSAADQYTYVALAPAITSVSPTSGPTTGGTVVRVIGANFPGTSGLKFGATSASTFTVLTPNQISVTSPAHASGTVDITATTYGGTSPTSTADQFTYTGGGSPPPPPGGGGGGGGGTPPPGGNPPPSGTGGSAPASSALPASSTSTPTTTTGTSSASGLSEVSGGSGSDPSGDGTASAPSDPTTTLVMTDMSTDSSFPLILESAVRIELDGSQAFPAFGEEADLTGDRDFAFLPDWDPSGRERTSFDEWLDAALMHLTESDDTALLLSDRTDGNMEQLDAFFADVATADVGTVEGGE